MSLSKSTLSREIEIEFSPDCWSFEARWRNLSVGRARCVQEGASLLIGDLQVYDACHIPWPLANGILVMIGLHRRTRGFRRLGVGTALLNRIISEGAKAGISRLWGNITPGDIGATPRLLDWYHAKGFEVSYQNDDTSIKSVATISMCPSAKLFSVSAWTCEVHEQISSLKTPL